MRKNELYGVEFEFSKIVPNLLELNPLLVLVFESLHFCESLIIWIPKIYAFASTVMIQIHDGRHFLDWDSFSQELFQFIPLYIRIRSP